MNNPKPQSCQDEEAFRPGDVVFHKDDRKCRRPFVIKSIHACCNFLVLNPYFGNRSVRALEYIEHKEKFRKAPLGLAIGDRPSAIPASARAAAPSIKALRKRPHFTKLPRNAKGGPAMVPDRQIPPLPSALAAASPHPLADLARQTLADREDAHGNLPRMESRL